MKKLGLKKLGLFVLLMAFGSIVPAYGGIYDIPQDIVESNFLVDNSPMRMDKNFIEIRYSDYGTGGDEDAFVNIKISLITTDGKEILLATMPRCHDEMKWYNTDYGVLSFSHVSETTRPRLAYFHYYPTNKAIAVLSAIHLTGFWDTDDDGGKGFDIDLKGRIAGASRFNSTGKPNNLAFTRPAPHTLAFTGETTGLETGGFTQYLALTDNDQKYDMKYGNFGTFYDGGKMVSSGTLTSEFNPATPDSIYAYVYFSKMESVKNNSVGSTHDEFINITQKFYSPSYLFTAKPYAKPINLTGYRDGFSLLANLSWEFENTDVTEEDIQVYRRLATDAPDKREKVGSVPYFFTNSSEHSIVEDVFADYVYEVVVSPQSWGRPICMELSSSAVVHGVKPWEGKGTKESPYLVKTIDDLALLSGYVNHDGNTVGKYWKQTADIDVKNIRYSPIGMFPECAFKGHYDGNGYKVKDIYFNDSEKVGVGMFGYINGEGLTGEQTPVVENLHVVNFDCEAKSDIGSLVGNVKNAIIRNCHASGNVSPFHGGGFVGGMLGQSYNSIIENCSFVGEVFGETSVCGFAYKINGGSISNCYVSASVISRKTYFHFCESCTATMTNCFFDNTKTPGEAIGKGLPDLTGTALVGQFGVGNWNFASGKLPVQKVFDKENAFDVTLTADSLFNDIVAPVENVKVKYQYKKNGKHMVLLLPFALDSKQIVSMSGKIYSYQKCHSDGNVFLATFREVAATGANVPYLFKDLTSNQNKTAEEYDSFCFEGVTLVPTTNMDDASVAPVSSKMVGTYKKALIPNGGYLFESLAAPQGNVVGMFNKASLNDEVLPMSAYLWNGNLPASATTIGVVLLDGSSSIEEIFEDGKTGVEGVYNLNGQRLSEPVEGVNIINGQKVMKWK